MAHWPDNSNDRSGQTLYILSIIKSTFLTFNIPNIEADWTSSSIEHYRMHFNIKCCWKFIFRLRNQPSYFEKNSPVRWRLTNDVLPTLASPTRMSWKFIYNNSMNLVCWSKQFLWHDPWMNINLNLILFFHLHKWWITWRQATFTKNNYSTFILQQKIVYMPVDMLKAFNFITNFRFISKQNKN